MKFGVVVFPGSNCDQDCFHVIKNVLKEQVEYVWHKSSDIARFDAIVLPGGFSYGDYLRTGAIARFSPVMQAVQRHAQQGKPVLGICNGFQILLEAGLLPGAMLRNRSLRFVCRHVSLVTASAQTPFTARLKKGQALTLPVAHGEGNYTIDDAGLAELKKNDQIVFRYADNPNGSADDIAGICNRQRNVLGMMPHPERASEDCMGSRDGLAIFESMRDNFGAVAR